MMTVVSSVVLAAGQGTRMRSKLPKVLHPLLGHPMAWYSLETARQATGTKPIIVIGHQAEEVRQELGDAAIYIIQEPQLGTGHAVIQARSLLSGHSDLVLVTYADMPLLTTTTLRGLIEAQRDHTGPITMLTITGGDPRGFGRIIRDDQGNVTAIVEEALATPNQLAITELNPSIYCFQGTWLWEALEKIQVSPKGEYYLTDLVEIATSQGLHVQAFTVPNSIETIGINTRIHLAEAEAALRRRINHEWMLAGVTLVDPTTTYIEPDVRIGVDTVIWPNTYLLGMTQIGEDCYLGPNTVFRNAVIGNHCKVFASVIENQTLEDDTQIGSFMYHK